jgi:sugar lactone lactonase YvrE
MTSTVFSDTQCVLGEGIFWHPLRQSVFWFDILSHRLYERTGEEQSVWQFDRAVSAAGWIDDTRLIVASERDVFVFDLEAHTESTLVNLEADNPVTRSNDGRADPMGGFWIGTMGYNLEPNAGAIYRYYRGEIRKLFDGLTITNAICFSPDGKVAYFTDTPTQIIRRVALDEQGWPMGEPENWLDLTGDGLNPDGAVVDDAGNLWNAQWGASRVACYDSDGRFLSAINFPAEQISCPAFGGADGATLFATSASEGAGAEDVHAGQVFAAAAGVTGQREHQVVIG